MIVSCSSASPAAPTHGDKKDTEARPQLTACQKVAELPFREVCVPPEVGAIIKFDAVIRAKVRSTFCNRIGEAYGTDTAH